MTGWFSYLSLEAPHRKQVTFLMVVISVLYLFNFHVNDIWTPNESFYAEAVREMFESGNFLEFFYNYEPRYNKPPLTYWIIAASSSIFGMNEFGIRLPIVLMWLGSSWLTYLLGKRLFGDRGGLYALGMMSLSLQMLALKQFASPEMPLTFFFTLTMYWFVKGYQDENFKYTLLFYIALGLTVLTKGYPYIIVIGGIVGLYVLWDTELKWKALWHKIKYLRLYLGLPLVVLIGVSWVIYMYLQDGQDFWTIYRRETFERALTRKTNGMKPFFYVEVISWSIAPYSLAFFYALIKWVKDWRMLKRIALPFSWFIVMFTIFTIAKGKLPPYMLQAHPGLLLMIVPLLLNAPPKDRISKVLWATCFILPTTISLVANVFAVSQLKMHWIFYLIPLLLLILMARFIINRDEINLSSKLVAAPFWTLFGVLIIFGAYLPRMEAFRPYDEIGRVLNEEHGIDKKIPIKIQATLIHNIPFYTERFAERDQTPAQINEATGPTLALVRAENMDEIAGFESLWTGKIYDFSSESQFLKFIIACLKAEDDDFSNFADYHLVYRE